MPVTRALKPEEDIDYGYPPGLEHLTFDEFIQQGEDDIAAGRIFTHEQVVAELEALRASYRKS